MRTVPYVLVLTLALIASANAVRAEGDSDKERGALAKALSTAKVSLGAGLSASQSEGKPISAKFELEDGKLQLSVYTQKNGTFSEVIVDHQSGKVAKTEPITDGEDLSAAKAQSSAMAKATASLDDALRKATTAQSGYLAVRVTPKLTDGHPTAEVVLVKGQDWKTVTENLD